MLTAEEIRDLNSTPMTDAELEAFPARVKPASEDENPFYQEVGPEFDIIRALRKMKQEGLRFAHGHTA